MRTPPFTILSGVVFLLGLSLLLFTSESKAQSITMSFPQSTSYINTIPIVWSITPTTQTLTEVRITFTGTGGRTAGVVTTLTMTSANTIFSKSFTFNPQDMFNASNPYTVPSGAVFPDGSYTARMTYARSDSVSFNSSTASLSYDGTTLTPTLTSPASGAAFSDSMQLKYLLPETPRLSVVFPTLTFTGAVNTTPVVISLARSPLDVDFNISTTNIQTSVNIISTTATSLPEDIYSVVLSYQDTSNHAAATATSTGVIIDRTSPSLSMVTAAPAIGRNTHPSFTFNTNESGTLGFSGGCSSTTTSATSGNNTITLSSNTSGAALNEGTYSSCTVSVTDAAGNISTSLTIPTFVIDLTPPVVTLIGSSFIGAVIGNTYTDAGATATDTHDGSLTSSLSSVIAGNTTTVGSSFTVTWSVSDAAGNTGSAVRTVLNIAPTPTPVPSIAPTNNPNATPTAVTTAISSPVPSPTPKNSEVGEVTGYIFSSDGQPLSGIVVYLYSVEVGAKVNTNTNSLTNGTGVLSTLTDENGKYTFRNLAKGDYLVKPNLTDTEFEPPSEVSSSGGTPPSFIATSNASSVDGCVLQDRREGIVASDSRARRLTNFGQTLARRYSVVANHTLDGNVRKNFTDLMQSYIGKMNDSYTSILRASEVLPKIEKSCPEVRACSLVQFDKQLKSYKSSLKRIDSRAFGVLALSRKMLNHVSVVTQVNYRNYGNVLLRRAIRETGKLPSKTYVCAASG